MGRAYAGILGPLSFGTIIARGLLDGGNVESALMLASLALFAFAAVGYVVGITAERIVAEAIEARFQAQRRADESAAGGAERTHTPTIVSDAAA